MGNYLILLIHDAYDIPGRTRDGIEMEDASDEVYDYILACICPVDLSQTGLSYNAKENTFQNRLRDWVVGMPDTAFLFPAFNDRSADIHSTLYYSKDAKELKEEFINKMLGCKLPLSAECQKEAFQALVEEVLGDDCSVESVKNIHEKLTKTVQKQEDNEEPMALGGEEVKTVFASSGVSNDKMEIFDQCFDEIIGRDTKLLLNNIYSGRNFEVKTDLIKVREIDGRQQLVIDLQGPAEVNGVEVRPMQ